MTANNLLNELIELNNDRIAGFEKVLADIDDENIDLKEIFQEFATQSRRFSLELTAVVASRDGEPETDNSVAGSLHRAWIDVKSLFGGSDRASILSEAERGEDTIKKAYTSVLEQGRLDGEALQTVSSQSTAINRAHDTIKALRDMAKQ